MDIERPMWRFWTAFLDLSLFGYLYLICSFHSWTVFILIAPRFEELDDEDGS